MPMAAWAAAEWAEWICKKDGRAQRVQTALVRRLYPENSNWGRVLARPPARLTRTWSPIAVRRHSSESVFVVLALARL